LLFDETLPELKRQIENAPEKKMKSSGVNTVQVKQKARKGLI
jgi:hypothetical protein